MSTWLKADKPIRTQPRLWVEMICLVESREPLAFTRSIHLHTGLNIVWAKESASSDPSGLTGAGHGVGKTSLCLLLRYILGDDAPAITILRGKAAGSFPKGGVAAKVHLDGATWMVFRPYGSYSDSMAAQCETLDQLVQRTAPNDFDGYGAALKNLSIGRLAANTLPGTNQLLEWHHLLAWCIREQRTRFDGFYHWREGEGLGFKRPRRDPPLLVDLVLGLMDHDLDRLLRDIETKQKQVEQCKERIHELEKAPAFALAYAERQLRWRVQAGEGEPVFITTASESIESRVQSALHGAELKERQWEHDAKQAEETLAKEQIHLGELTNAQNIAEVATGIAKSLMETNQADFERLTKKWNELEALEGRCEYGDVEFRECQYVKNRKGTVSITWFQDSLQVKVDAPALAERYEAKKRFSENAARAASDQARIVAEGRSELHRLRVRIATSESSRALLKHFWDELQRMHAERASGEDTAELVEVRAQLKELETRLDSLRAAELNRTSQQSSRVNAIKALTAALSTRILGAARYARFMPGDEVRPFEIARGGEAYQVLEVLLGDIVCLLDSAVSGASNHPGFLVHDCPREADMSERLYREFFLTAAEAAEQLGADGAVPFQFIVTTTSAPPEELSGSPYVVLKLTPGADEALLFKRQLAPELSEFDLV